MASSTQVLIDIATFKKFVDLLGNINKKLSELDTHLRGIQSLSRKIQFSFTGLKDFQEFLRVVSSYRGIKNADKFAPLITATADIKKAADNVKGIPKTDMKVVIDFLTAIQTLSSFKITPGKLKSVITSIDTAVAQVNAVITKVTTFPPTAQKAILSFTDMFKTLTKFIEGFQALSAIQPQNVMQSASLLGGIIVQLDNIGSKIGPQTVQNLAGFAAIFKVFSTVFSGGKGNPVEQSVRSITQFLKFAVGIPTVIAITTTIFKMLGALFTFIPGSFAMRRLGEALQVLANTFVTFGKALGGKNEDIGQSLARSIGTYLKFFVGLPLLMASVLGSFKLIGLVLAALPGTESITKIANAIRAVGLGFSNFSGVFDTRSIKQNFLLFTVVLPLMFGAMSTMFRLIAVVVKAIPSENELSTLSRSMRNIGLALQNFTTVLSTPGVSAAQPNTGFLAALSNTLKLAYFIPRIFKSIADAIRGITTTAISKGVFDQMIEMTKNFSRIGEALTNLSKSNKDLSLFGVLQLGVKIRVLGGIITAIANSLKLGSNADADAFGKIMLSIGRAMDAMTLALKRSKGQNLTSVFNLLKLFLFFKTLINTVKGILKDASGSDMTGAARILSSLGKLFEAVFTALDKQVTKKSSIPNILGVQDRVKFIQNLLKEVRKFKGAQLPDLGSIFKALPQFLKDLSSLSLDKAGGDKLKANIGHIQTAMQELRKLKGNPKAFAVLNSLVETLKNLNGIKATGSVAKILTSFQQMVQIVNAIKINPKDFKVLSEVTKEIAKAMNNLNTITSTEKQIEALKALVEVIKAVVKSGQGNQLSIPLPKIDKTQLNTIGLGTGEDLSKAVETGFLRAGLKVAIAKFLVNVFKDIFNLILKVIDPRRIINAFTTGFDALTRFAALAVTGLSKVRQLVIDLSERMKSLGTQVQTAGQNLINSFGLNTLFNSQGFLAAANFDRLKNQVQTFGDFTEEQMKRVLDAANQVGIDFPLSAADALKAGLDLVKAGLNDAAVAAVLKQVASLQTLTQGTSEEINIEEVSQGLIQAVNVSKEFRENVPASFENSAVAADIFSSAADLTTASVKDLFDGMANIGPVGAQFGLTLEQQVAILAKFNDAGTRGAEAGTALRQMLTRLTNPQAQKELNKLGVAWTDAGGNIRDVFDIFKDIEEKFNKSTIVSFIPRNVTAENASQIKVVSGQIRTLDRQLLIAQNGLDRTSQDAEANADRINDLNASRANAINLLQQLTGDQNSAARITAEIHRTEAQNVETLRKIFGPYGQIGATILLDDVNQMDAFIERMRDMPPAAQRALALMENFQGQSEQLAGSLETLQTVGLAPLIEKFFTPMVKLLKDVFNGFLSLDDRTLEFVGTMVALGSTSATVIGAFLIALGVLSQFGGAIVGIAAGFVSLQVTGLTVLTFLSSVVVGLLSVVAVVTPIVIVLGLLSLAFQGLSDIWNNNTKGVRSLFEGMVTLSGKAFTAIGELGGAVKGFFDVFKGEASGGDVIGFFADLISKGIVKADIAIGSFTRKVQSLKTLFQGLTTLMEGGLLLSNADISTNRNALNKGLAFTSLEDLTNNPFLQAILGQRGDKVNKAGIERFVNDLKSASTALQERFAVINSTFEEFATKLKSGKLKAAFDGLSKELPFAIGHFAAEVTKQLGLLFNIDTTKITGLLDGAKFAEVGQLVVDTLLTKLKESVVSNRGTIVSVLSTVFKSFFIPGKFIGTIAKLLGLDDVSKIFDQYTGIITGLFEGVLNTIINLMAGQDIKTALRNAFGDGIEPVLKFIASIGKTISNVVGLIGALVSIFFVPENADVSDFNLITFLEGLFEGASALLDSLNKDILEPLRKNLQNMDFSGVTDFFGELFTGLGTFVTQILSADFAGAAQTIGALISHIVDGIGALFEGIGNAEEALSPNFVQRFAAAFLTVLQAALQIAFGAIGGLLKLDTAKIIANIGAAFDPLIKAIEGGDPIAIFGGLANAVGNLLIVAIKTVVEGVGKLVGIDTTKIVNDLQAGMDANISATEQGGPGAPFYVFGNTIATLIAAAINTAVGGVGSLINVDTTNITTVIDEKLGTVRDDLDKMFLAPGNVFSSVKNIVDDLALTFKALFDAFTPPQGDPIANAKNLEAVLTKIALIPLDVVIAPFRALRILLERLAALNPLQTALVLGSLAGLLLVKTGATFLAGIDGISNLATALQLVAIDKMDSIKSVITTASNSVIAKGAAIFVIGDFIVNLVKNITELDKLDVGRVFGAVVQSFVDLAVDIASVFGIEHIFDPMVTAAQQLPLVMNVSFTALGATLYNALVKPVLGFFTTTLPALVLDAKMRVETAVPGDQGSEAQAKKYFNITDTLDKKGGVSFAELIGLKTDVAPEDLEMFRLITNRYADKIFPVIRDEFARANNSKDPSQFKNFILDAIGFGSSTGTVGNIFDEIQKTYGSAGIQRFAEGFADILRTSTEDELKQAGISQETVDTFANNILNAFQLNKIKPADALRLVDLLTVDGTFDSAATDNVRAQIENFLKDVLHYSQAQIDDLMKDPEAALKVKQQIETELPPPSPDEAKVKLEQWLKDSFDAEAMSVATNLGLTVKLPGPEFFIDNPDATFQDYYDAVIAILQGSASGEGDIKSVDGATGVETPVQPTPTVADPDKAKEDWQQAVSDAIMPDGSDPLDVETPTNPLFDASNLSTPEDAEKLQTALNDLSIEFTNLNTTVTDMVDPFTTNITAMQAIYLPFKDILISTLQTINALWEIMRMAIFNLFGMMSVQFPAMIGLAFVFGAGMDGVMTHVTNKVNETIKAVNNLKRALQEMINVLPSFFGVGSDKPPEKRAKGGPVGPGVFEVNEGGVPEMLYSGGRSYLLPGRSGYVVPISDMPKIGSGQYASAMSPSSARPWSGGGSTNVISYQEGNIQLTVQVDGGEPTQVVNAIRSELAPHFISRNENVRRTLIRAGASGI